MCQATKQLSEAEHVRHHHHLDHQWMRSPMQLFGELVQEAPQCSSWASRVWRTGTSAKTGKDWAKYGHVLAKSQINVSRCGMVFTSRGKWEPQV
jgi:hypothetical protein